MTTRLPRPGRPAPLPQRSASALGTLWRGRGSKLHYQMEIFRHTNHGKHVSIAFRDFRVTGQSPQSGTEPRFVVDVGRGVPRVSGSYSVCAVAAEGMDSSSPSNHFATVRHSPRDEIFVSDVQRNAPPIDNQGVASLHYDYVFVVVMSMRGGWRCLTTPPKRHLAPVSSIEDVALDSRCRLICCRDPVCWMLHELGKIVHGRLLSHSGRWLAWPRLDRSTESRIHRRKWPSVPRSAQENA
jgi:hypothetical protein